MAFLPLPTSPYHFALPFHADNSLSVHDHTAANILSHEGGDKAGDRAPPLDPFSMEDEDYATDILPRDGGDRALPIDPFSIEDDILPHDGGFPPDGVNSLPPEGFTGDMATDGDIYVPPESNNILPHHDGGFPLDGVNSLPPEGFTGEILSHGGDNSIIPQDWRMSIPLGMKFRPTDEELVINYLELESFGITSSSDGIINRLDVYAHQPHHLPSMAVDFGDGKMYFYTYVKKIGKSKYDRKIKSRPGCHWKTTQAPKPIKGRRSGATHGFKMPLAYYEEENKKTQWLMQEYRLKSNSSSPKEHDLVLAVIYYHHRKSRGEDEDS